MKTRSSFFSAIWTFLIVAGLFLNPAMAQDNASAKILYLTGLNDNAAITLTNSEDAEDLATVKAYDANGLPLGTVFRTLSPGQTETVESQELPDGIRSVTVEYNGNLSCSAIVNGQNISAIEKPLTQFDFPAENTSAVVVLNPNDSQADVSIIALDKDGIEIERSTIAGLYPMESREFVVKDIFKSDILKVLSFVKVESPNVIISYYIDNIEDDGMSVRRSKRGSSSCQQNAVGGQCVAYARKWATDNWNATTSMVPLLGTNGGAYLIYDRWNLNGGKGSVPANNSLMVLDQGTGISYGHVGVVINSSRNSDGTYTLTVNESNWDLDEKIDCNVTYTYKNQTGGIVVKRGSSNKWLKLKGFVYSKANPATGSVSGKLHENTASGPALSGATVTCGGKSTTTDLKGSFSLSGISTGWQNLKFTKTGYQSYEKGVYITAGQTANAGDVYLVGGKDQATFAGENYPDNTSVTGGTSFRKEWKIKNTGGTTWTSAYKLRLYKFTGSRLSTVSEVSGTPEANSVYSFQVPMKAPAAQTSDKTYREEWNLIGPSGIIPVSGSQIVWVQIKVPVSQPTTGGVYGRLHENSAVGPELSGVSVSIRGTTAVTDGSGFYRLSGVPSGWQTLKFSKSGYQSFEKGVNITAGQDADAGDSYLVKNPIVSPSITIQNPSPGETWRSDEDRHIEWTYSNFPSKGDVRISYKISSSDSWRTIESSTTNDGGRWWKMCDFHTEDSSSAQIMIQSIQYPDAIAIVTFKMDHAKECQ